jgi:hypothetical protein
VWLIPPKTWQQAEQMRRFKLQRFLSSYGVMRLGCDLLQAKKQKILSDWQFAASLFPL